jgi:hypothetical protein
VIRSKISTALRTVMGSSNTKHQTQSRKTGKTKGMKNETLLKRRKRREASLLLATQKTMVDLRKRRPMPVS